MEGGLHTSQGVSARSRSKMSVLVLELCKDLSPVFFLCRFEHLPKDTVSPLCTSP